MLLHIFIPDGLFQKDLGQICNIKWINVIIELFLKELLSFVNNKKTLVIIEITKSYSKYIKISTLFFDFFIVFIIIFII